VIYFLGVSLSCLIAFLWHSNSLKVDYSKLEFLLSQGKWIESDLYTEELVDRLLSKAVDDSRFFGFSRLDFFRLQRTSILHSGRLPCEELDKIDRLWAKYSDGNFGLTAQAKIALSIQKPLPTLTGHPNWTWDISELENNFGWHHSDLVYLEVPKWYGPANVPEKSVGFLPSERWILRNAGGGKPTYTYSNALKHFIVCKGLK
jgi:GUN4-like